MNDRVHAMVLNYYIFTSLNGVVRCLQRFYTNKQHKDRNGRRMLFEFSRLWADFVRKLAELFWLK